MHTQLGEKRAEAHRQAHHRLLADTIAEHRGTLHDYLGDGIMAWFTGAAHAVAATVAIQQAIAADGRRGDAPAVAVRVNPCFLTPLLLITPDTHRSVGSIAARLT